MRKVMFEEIKRLRAEGRKTTNAFLYEQQNCRDGSEFVLVVDHPLGRNTPTRIWPVGAR